VNNERDSVNNRRDLVNNRRDSVNNQRDSVNNRRDSVNNRRDSGTIIRTLPAPPRSRRTLPVRNTRTRFSEQLT
jgi:hypothetical protein